MIEDFVVKVPKILRYGSDFQSIFDALRLWEGPSPLKRVEETLHRQFGKGVHGEAITVTGISFGTLITRFEHSAHSKAAVWPSDIFSMADCYDPPLFPLPPIAALYIAAFHSEKISLRERRTIAYCKPPTVVDAKEHRWDWEAYSDSNLGRRRRPTNLVLGLARAVRLFQPEACTVLSGERDILLLSPDPQPFIG